MTKKNRLLQLRNYIKNMNCKTECMNCEQYLTKGICVNKPFLEYRNMANDFKLAKKFGYYSNKYQKVIFNFTDDEYWSEKA